MQYIYNEDSEYTNSDSHGIPAVTRKLVNSHNPSRLIPDKILAPLVKDFVARPRLIRLLDNSMSKFGATLLLGRAGTGKTTLAAHYAGKYEQAAWFNVDSADVEWAAFFRYFRASFKDPLLMQETEQSRDFPKPIAYSVETFFSRLSVLDSGQPRLIVLDNVHNIFDADWFGAFFFSLIHSLMPNMHLLLLTRCKPPTPLWRLRSKQRLGVIDERKLAFNDSETQILFEKLGLSSGEAESAQNSSFGRISKLREFAAALSIEERVSI
ncbi:MAG: hypothetical protein HKN33_05920 [Pyrinomonadaceae bacterium]|nr:hypothetical protein [Pyrinomonadaceae bacterium]